VSEVKNGFTSGVKSECAVSIVPVTVKAVNSHKQVNTYAFLDTGSTASFCTERLMHALNLRGNKVQISLSTMSDDCKLTSSYVLKGLELGSLNGKDFTELPELFTQARLPVTRKEIPTQEDIDQWPYLSKVNIPVIDADVDLLIGCNAPTVLEPHEIIPSQNSGPYASRTVLGWTINGPVKQIMETDNTKCARISVNKVSVLEEQLQQYFNQDFTERVSDDKQELSQDDQRFLDLASKSIHLENGHYVLNLPFRNDSVTMPNNRPQAEQRVAMLAKKFTRKEGFHKEHTAFMNNVIDQGYAREVPEEQLNMSNGKVWYLPHHGV
jgi:hypothetical protein